MSGKKPQDLKLSAMINAFYMLDETGNLNEVEADLIKGIANVLIRKHIKESLAY